MSVSRHSAAEPIAHELGMTIRRALSSWQYTLRLVVIIAMLTVPAAAYGVSNRWSSAGHLDLGQACVVPDGPPGLIRIAEMSTVPRTQLGTLRDGGVRFVTRLDT